MKAEAAPVQGGWKRAAAVYLALILLVRLALHLFLFRALDGNLPTGPDEAEKIWFAWDWSRRPVFAVHGSWLPLPFWLLGSCMWLIPDPVRASVVCCVILGLACLYLLWRIGSRLFPEDPLAALLPAAVVAGSASQVWAATIPTADVVLTFFVLAGIHSALLWEESGSAFHKWLAMAFFSLSAWTRYEGLLFCGAFAFWMAAAHRDWSGIAVFACPLLWGLQRLWAGGGHLAEAFRVGLARGEGNLFVFPDWKKLADSFEFLFLRPPFAGQALLLSVFLPLFRGQRREEGAERFSFLIGFLPLAAYLLLGFLASVTMLQYHFTPFEAALAPLWGGIFLQCVRNRGEGWKHILFVLALALCAGQAALRGIPFLSTLPSREPVSRHLGAALKSWSRGALSGRDSVLVELPTEEARLSKYVWIWKSLLIPHDLHMDRYNFYRWRGESAQLIEENNPSLFSLPAAALADWLAAHRVRLVVAQNRLGREKMAALAGWERACRTGGYDLYLKKGESGRESLLRRLEEADRR